MPGRQRYEEATVSPGMEEVPEVPVRWTHWGQKRRTTFYLQLKSARSPACPHPRLRWLWPSGFTCNIGEANRKVIPTLEGTPFSARLLSAATGLLPLFISRQLRIRNEKKGCSPCFSSSAHRLSPPPPHSPGPGATVPVRPGHFFRGASALCASLGIGVLFHSQNSLDLLVPYIGGVDIGWGGNSWSFCLNRACLSSLRMPYKLWGPLGKPHPMQMGTQAPLLCLQAASGSSTRPQPRKAPFSPGNAPSHSHRILNPPNSLAFA